MSARQTDVSPIPFSQLGIPIPENNLNLLDKKALDRYLGALFAARETLQRHWQANSEDLTSFDVVLATGIMIAVERRGLSQVMGEAQLLGWVETGPDILPIIEAQLRYKYENLKIGTQEKLDTVPIIGVVGKIASGKGTVAEILGKQFDVLAFPFSNRLRALGLVMGFQPPYTREQLRKINDIYKPAFGNQIFVEWTLTQALRMSKALHMPQIIVPDGFRSVAEAEYFLQLPNTHLVAIIADHDIKKDRQIRYQRQLERRRGIEDSLTYDAFMRDDMVEGTWIDPVIELAKQRGSVILNNGGMDELTIATLENISKLITNIQN